MKLYDFDGMFDKKLSEYIKNNVGKFKESEWEDKIPRMYAAFGDKVIKSLGVSPKGYYAAMSADQLTQCLCAHIEKGVPVSEFLCSEIERRPECRPALIKILKEGSDELKSYAVNMLGTADCAIKEYIKIVVSDCDDDFKNQCADFIKENADLVKEEALENYNKGIESALMLEILSRVKGRDDRVYEILISAFRSGEDIPMIAGYLASYGDERALPYLMEKIDEEGISFIEFQELKYAIEALGGEYDKKRDFTGDEYYELIHSDSAVSEDIFSAFSDVGDEKK